MTENPYQPTDTPPRKKKWTVGQVIGLCLIVMVLSSLGPIERPPNSTGDFLDDLPYMAGRVFVDIAFLVVGLFLLLRKRPNSPASTKV